MRIRSGGGDRVLLFLVSAAIAAGVWFRFDDLGRKVYWHDETWTSFQITGHQTHEFSTLAARGPFTLADLRRMQERDGRDFRDVWDALTVHGRPPLHYLAAWSWSQVFGYSPSALRALAAFFGLLTIPSMFWLAGLAGSSRRCGMIAAALCAISPLFVLYSQESREYALFALNATLSTAALLSALRRNTRVSWLLFAGATAAGLYTHLLFPVVTLSHVLIACSAADGRLRRPFFHALGLSAAIFAPWLALIVVRSLTDLGQFGHLVTPIPIAVRAAWYLNQGSTLFFDPEPRGVSSVFREPLLFGVRLLFDALIVSSLVFLVGKRKPIAVIVFAMAAFIIPIAAADAVTGGTLTLNPRYLLPFWVALLVGVSVALDALLDARRSAGVATLAALVACGTYSAWVSNGATEWWTKWLSFNRPSFARTLVAAPGGTLIVFPDQATEGNLTSLARLTGWNASTRVYLDPAVMPKVESGSAVYVINPDAAGTRLSGARLEPYDRTAKIWKLLP